MKRNVANYVDCLAHPPQSLVRRHLQPHVDVAYNLGPPICKDPTIKAPYPKIITNCISQRRGANLATSRVKISPQTSTVTIDAVHDTALNAIKANGTKKSRAMRETNIRLAKARNGSLL